MRCPTLCDNATQFIIIYEQNERKWLNVIAEVEEIILDMQGKNSQYTYFRETSDTKKDLED